MLVDEKARCVGGKCLGREDPRDLETSLLMAKSFEIDSARRQFITAFRGPLLALTNN